MGDKDQLQMGDKDQLQMGDKDQQRKAMENQYIKTSTQDNHRLSKLPPPPPPPYPHLSYMPFIKKVNCTGEKWKFVTVCSLHRRYNFVYFVILVLIKSTWLQLQSWSSHAHTRNHEKVCVTVSCRLKDFVLFMLTIIIRIFSLM